MFRDPGLERETDRLTTQWVDSIDWDAVAKQAMEEDQ